MDNYSSDDDNIEVTDLNKEVIQERIYLPLVPNFKKIHDSMHGYIGISNYACRIIDSKYFQQLRNKKQLGSAYYVFPNAIHTRFEHSLGTYNFASRIMDCIIHRTKQTQISDYLSKIKYLQKYFKFKYDGKAKIDNFICELVKIGALCHDLGHGPFSHLFDDNFLPSVYNSDGTNTEYHKILNITHEERSANLIEKIIKSDDILKKIILDDEIEFIKHLINPTKEDTGFLFQIVSNYLNGLDVDKYDYLIRDSKTLGFNLSFDVSRLVDDIAIVNNNICYPEQVIFEIYNMFNLRYNLHKMVYNHKTVISAQMQIIEIMKLINSELKLSESITDLDKFILIGDNTIFDFINLYKTIKHIEDIPENIKKAQEILDKINKHDSYYFVDSIISKNGIENTKDTILQNLDKKTQSMIADELIIFQTKIGLVSGDKQHPLDSIYSYSTKSMLQKDIPDVKKIQLDSVSLLIPKVHQEYITMFYVKNESNKKVITKAKDIITKIRALI